MLRAFWKGFIALLRELGDENAYARHLRLHGEAHSGAAWRRFHEHKMQSKYQRAKCC